MDLLVLPQLIKPRSYSSYVSYASGPWVMTLSTIYYQLYERVIEKPIIKKTTQSHPVIPYNTKEIKKEMETYFYFL